MGKYVLSLGILLSLILTGCNNQPISKIHQVVDTRQVDSSDPRILVVYGDKEFNDKLLVVRKIIDDSGNQPKVSVTLQNISNKTFIVEYQFQWLETSGMPIMQTPAWHRVTLSPNAVKPLINVAKVPGASNVEFTVRLPMSKLYQQNKDKNKK